MGSTLLGKNANMENTIYSEVQRFRQPFLYMFLMALLLIILFVMVFSFIGPYLIDTPASAKEAMDSDDIIINISAMVLLSIFIIVLYFLKLETHIKDGSVYVRLFPIKIKYREIPSSKIASYYSREYRPILEYGGWGIRFSFAGKGMAYNAFGNEGIQFELKNGKKVLIGTQKSNEFLMALNLMALNKMKN